MKKHLPESLETKALELLQKREKMEKLRVGSVEVDNVPSTGKTLYKIDAFKAGDPNGPHCGITLDEDEKEVDLKALSESEGKAFFSRKTFVLGKPVPMASPAASITIEPNENVLVLKQGETFNEVITVKVPGDAGVSKVDVYFLADTTGSMSSILMSVQDGANNILATLNGLGLDMAFGVGNYKDFPNDPFAFQHQQNLTTAIANVTNAINAWSAEGGFDTPEGQLFALDQIADVSGGTIGWRSDAKRILVWFGDAPAHDTVCSEISSLPYDITEASVRKKLVAESISVIAISTDTGVIDALDGDPTDGGNYTSVCGPAGGSPGQASRITNATGGTHVMGIDETTIVNTIINLVSSAATTINNLDLVPTGETASFVVSTTPAGGFGPLSGDEDHELLFQAEFKGVKPCSDEDQTFKGFIEAVADRVVVARKRVQVTVPACKPKELYSYSVKFICGVQEACECTCTTGVRPGIYATDINIHNYQDEKVSIEKYVLPLVFVGSPQGREPRVVRAKAGDKLILPGNTATMDDCCRLAELLFDSVPPAKQQLTIGFLEIVSPIELQVTAVYTATDLESRSISIDVEQIAGKIKKGKARKPGRFPDIGSTRPIG
jgi:hypothetical protein